MGGMGAGGMGTGAIGSMLGGGGGAGASPAPSMPTDSGMLAGGAGGAGDSMMPAQGGPGPATPTPDQGMVADALAGEAGTENGAGEVMASRADPNAVGGNDPAMEALYEHAQGPKHPEGVPDNHKPFEQALDSATDDPRQAALMQAMGLMEFQNIKPDQYWKQMSGGGGKMQGVLQTNTGVHGTFENPDDYMAKQLEFWGGGKTPTGRGQFDVDKAWSHLEGNASDGVTGADFQSAIRAGGFGTNDYHPLGVKGAGARVPDHVAEYLYNKGQGPVSQDEIIRALEGDPSFVGF